MRIVSDLNKPMQGTGALDPDIPYHWHLCDQALVEKDCVPIQLAMRLAKLGVSLEYVRRTLDRSAAALGQDGAEGYTMDAIIHALKEFSYDEDKQVGWRIFAQDGTIVSERPPRGTPHTSPSSYARGTCTCTTRQATVPT